MLTPNSQVSRTARIEADGPALAAFFARLAMDNPAVPVKVLFEPKGASCWTMNAGKTLMVLLDRWAIDGLKVKEPCVIVCNPKELSDLIRAKSRGGAVRLTTAANEPIAITTKDHGGAEVMPADEDDCLTIPDRNVLPYEPNTGQRLFPMFDNEPPTYTATLVLSELTKASMEMQTANAPYVSVSFDAKSEARAGHWSGKTTRSWSPLDVISRTGGPFTVSFTDTLKSLISVLNGATDPLRVSKHHKGHFLVVETTTGNKTTIVATEAIKET
jgi:hypothetical protein